MIQAKVDIAQLVADAEKAGVKVQDLRKLFLEIGRPLRREARGRTPVGKTRRLRQSIRVYARKDRVGLMGRVRLNEKGQGNYAPPVHWGWDGHSGPKFLRETLDPKADQITRQVRDGIDRLLHQLEFN